MRHDIRMGAVAKEYGKDFGVRVNMHMATFLNKNCCDSL